MSEKVESGLEVVAWAPSAALEKLATRNNNAPCVLTDGPAEFNDVPLIRQSDAERALQLKHEAHRKTWRQLEQVMGLLREVRDRVPLPDWARARIDALFQQAEPVEPKCRTCRDVGIIGHSTICPECADTWAPPVEQAEPAPAQTEQQPVYQMRPRDNVREWSDIHPDGYRAAKAIGSLETRVVYAAPVAQTVPQPEQSADFHFRNGALEFAGYLLDNCEGATVAEESLQLWLSEALRNKATPSPAMDAKEE